MMTRTRARTLMAVAMALALSSACSSDGGAGAVPADRITYSLEPTTSAQPPPTRAADDRPTIVPTPAPTGTTPTEVRRALPASDRHLRPARGETFRAVGECGIDDRRSDTAACVDRAGSGGGFRVWAGQQETTLAWQVRVLIGTTERFDQSYATVLTRDIHGVTLHPGTQGGEAFVIVEYHLGGADRRSDFDIVTWESTQPEPAVVASLLGLPSPRLTIEGENARIASPNYADGAELCCPRFVDRTRLERVGPVAWEAAVLTEPLRPYDPPFEVPPEAPPGG